VVRTLCCAYVWADFVKYLFQPETLIVAQLCSLGTTLTLLAAARGNDSLYVLSSLTLWLWYNVL